MSGPTTGGHGTSASGLEEYDWRKSSRSGPQGNCVELATLPEGGVAMRNSRHPHGPVLVYPGHEVAVLIQALKDGEFDHLL